MQELLDGFVRRLVEADRLMHDFAGWVEHGRRVRVRELTRASCEP